MEGSISKQRRLGRRLSMACLVGMAVVTASCGSDTTGPSFPNRPAVATALASGQQFSCVLTTDGKSYCWGDNLRGQLGDSSFVPQLTPFPTAGGHQFVAIAAGYASACALDRGGVAWCWGDDPLQPGVPLSYRTVPASVPAPRPFTSITVGAKFGCGLDSNGAAYCWGTNAQGQLGVGDTLGRTNATPVQTSLRFASLVADFFSTCGLTAAGAAWCWGNNSFGELGTGDTNRALVPRAVSGTASFKQLSSGPIHECALTAANARYCWGSNLSGQIGDGSTTPRGVPQLVIEPFVFSSLRSSRANSIFSTTCGVVASGDVYCWGFNSKGQLGSSPAPAQPCFNGGAVFSTQCSYSPTKVAGVSNVASLDVGLEHICALTSDHSVFCWGDGAHGELGDGNGVASATPVQIKGNLPLP